jgi:propanol-preferring alcohol dehydrogenase
MRAMVLDEQRQPLQLRQLPIPSCGDQQVLIRVIACAVCRTDLHICDGDLTEPKLPLVPGHEIVGVVESVGNNVDHALQGQLVGVPWLGQTCGKCQYCQSGQENLCDEARFTGYDIDGGYAEYTLAHQHFVFPIDKALSATEAAPLLCAGLIGYRSLRMTGDAQSIGFYGFGAAAHIITQVAIQEGREVYAFTRPGDLDAQDFARRLGACWAGASDDEPPRTLDAAIIFAPVGDLVPTALRAVRKGGVVVCAGIYMSQIPAFPYSILWQERHIRSVANLTRADGEEFFELIRHHPVSTETTCYPLESANRALDDLRQGRLQGAAVLTMD